MIDKIPEGKSIGWMQAPPEWIFTHTLRFIGVVRIVIQDGEGFILIKKGKALAYYFKHGRIELHGHAALDYFNSQQTIEFNLCKYTPEEFAQALKICDVEDTVAKAAPEEPAAVSPPHKEPPSPKRPEPVAPVTAKPAAAREKTAEPARPAPAAVPPVAAPVKPKFSIELPPERKPLVNPMKPITAPPPAPAPVKPTVQVPPPPPGPVPPVVPPAAVPPVPPAAVPVQLPPMPSAPTVPPPTPFVPAGTTQGRVFVPQPAALEEPDIRIIGQIKKLNGIVAISVFNDDRNIILMGDVEIEPLLKIARTMLATTRKISPCLDWGSFVHMTLQIPEGNVIIAPYRDNYLCILTTRTINIGHIRRILRDLQQERSEDALL